MTKETILQKAIEKAEKNGEFFTCFISEWGKKHSDLLKTTTQDGFFISPLYYRIIFSHDFARAFWGEKPISIQSVMDFAHGTGEELPAWRAHLIWMVQKEDPLKYLEQFLET